MNVPHVDHLLVALDGSAVGWHAWEQAVVLARGMGAQLTALHVAVPVQPRNPMSRAEHWQVMAEARAQGARLLDQAQALAGDLVPCATELHTGDPVDAICRRAEELAADLIVVGNRGLGTLDRFLLGSVSTAVARRAPCSVLIVRRRERG